MKHKLTECTTCDMNSILINVNELFELSTYKNIIDFSKSINLNDKL